MGFIFFVQCAAKDLWLGFFVIIPNFNNDFVCSAVLKNKYKKQINIYTCTDCSVRKDFRKEDYRNILTSFQKDFAENVKETCLDRFHKKNKS